MLDVHRQRPCLQAVSVRPGLQAAHLVVGSSLTLQTQTQTPANIHHPLTGPRLHCAMLAMGSEEHVRTRLQVGTITHLQLKEAKAVLWRVGFCARHKAPEAGQAARLLAWHLGSIQVPLRQQRLLALTQHRLHSLRTCRPYLSCFRCQVVR